ncbi:MAG: SUMF1/EgtB/PvdO family nonheme iron enzyme [Thermodesulfobacteriota bacterium]
MKKRSIKHRGIVYLIIILILLFFARDESIAGCKKEGFRVREGIRKIYLGDINKGVEIIEKGSASCKSDYLYNYNLGIAYGFQKRYDKMADYLRKSIREKAGFRQGQLNLAWALINMEDHKNGLKIIQGLEKERFSSATRLITAYSYLLNGDSFMFERFRKEAVKLGLKEKDHFFRLIDEIQKESKAKAEMNNRLQYLYIDRGRLYEKIGDYEKAKEYYLKSGYKNAFLRLVSMLQNMGSSKKDIKKYLKPLLNRMRKVPRDVKDILKTNRYLTYPEGVLTFIYPEDLVKVPAGKAIIGLPGLRKNHKNDFREHEVFIEEFYIGKYEVTNIEYLIFVDSTGYPSPVNCCNSEYDLWQGGRFNKEIGLQPVVNVSWFDAMSYIKWKSRVSDTIYRLPSEKMWEKAARGSDGRIYPWGNEEATTEQANFNKNWHDDKLTALVNVNEYPKGRSPYGVFNMAGNAWEWSSSTYKSFSYRDLDTNLIISTKTVKKRLKVFRGGSWINKPEEIRTTFRNRNWPHIRYNGIGFRLARK